MAKLYAPFNEDQIQRLREYQEGLMHPFTCCGHDGCERPEVLNNGILIPITDGWICPCKKYTQNWCHDYMVEAVTTATGLVNEIFLLLNLAKSKGFDTSAIRPYFIESWMPIEKVYCNTVITIIAWWLREYQKILVWVEPIELKQFKPFIDAATKLGYDEYKKNILFNKDIIPGKYLTYEGAWLVGLTFALESLLDETK